MKILFQETVDIENLADPVSQNMLITHAKICLFTIIFILAECRMFVHNKELLSEVEKLRDDAIIGVH